MDLYQVIQHQGLQLILAHPLEQSGVIGTGVGRQESPPSRAWEAVARVVDETRGEIRDALPPFDALLFPESLAEAEDHLGGAGVVHGPQGLHLLG
ncbi:hypothetical protein J4Q44_G00335340 [Coregonus suidteri]|uniref:Uncharacterized protein n=1 Tax=Coregonus suidteri TaxID=861788 RepID=A0AAN8QDA4_9TELE